MKMREISRKKLLSIFSKLYPETGSELNFTTPFQLVVAVTLSAQCTDKKVNEITPLLFKRFNTFGELERAKVSEVEKIIRPINYYRTKAKNLVAMAKIVNGEFGGKLPITHEHLMTLPGVGRKTANVVLGELRITPCIPVDTHVFRVSKRLGLSNGKTPDDVEKDLRAKFAPESWYDLHHWLIYHGRRVCKAQRPLCSTCALKNLCPSAED